MGQYVSIDTEWFDLKTIHRPTSGKFALMTLTDDGENVYCISYPNLVPHVLREIQNSVWVIFGAQFDLTHMRRLAPIPARNKVVCVALMEKIMTLGLYELSGYSLKALARRYLGVIMDKEVRDEFFHEKPITHEMKQYACEDAAILHKVWMEQKKKLTQTHMRLWREVDLPALWAIMDMQSFRLDVRGWSEIAEIEKQKSLDIDATLPFNPHSPKATTEFLRQAGFKMLPSSGEDVLVKWKEKFPETTAAGYVDAVLESRGARKRATTYGLNFIENYIEDGQFLHSSFNVCGTVTGRFNSEKPNLQNIPARETKIYRERFIPRDGHKLVVSDWSQQEVFIAAYLSQDEKLISACNSGQDIYIQMVKIVYNIDVDKKNPLRGQMKAIVLGINYGMTVHGLASRLGVSKDEAEVIRRKFFSAFPQLAAWLAKQQQERNYVKTVEGRKIHLSPYSERNEQVAPNYPIQGTAADMMKKALARCHREWNYDKWGVFGFVAPVHDELVFDVPEQVAEEVAKFVSKVMVEEANRMCPGLSFRADATICNNWGEKE